MLEVSEKKRGITCCLKQEHWSKRKKMGSRFSQGLQHSTFSTCAWVFQQVHQCFSTVQKQTRLRLI